MSMFLAAAASGSSQAPLVPGWLDTWIAASPPGALLTAYGAYTTGVKFTATSGAYCNGVRFWWGTGAGPVSVKAALWRVFDGSLVASELISGVTGGAFYQTTGAFGSHLLTVGLDYIVSTYYGGGYNTATALTLSLPQSFPNYDVTAGFVGNGGGDGYPNGSPQAFGNYVEPIFL